MTAVLPNLRTGLRLRTRGVGCPDTIREQQFQLAIPGKQSANSGRALLAAAECGHQRHGTRPSGMRAFIAEFTLNARSVTLRRRYYAKVRGCLGLVGSPPTIRAPCAKPLLSACPVSLCSAALPVRRRCFFMPAAPE